MEFEYTNPETDQVENWEIDYRIREGEPERRNGHPDNWTPADPAEIRWLKILNEDGTDITAEVDDATIEEIEEAIWEEEETLAG